uniref:Uncharacterized protein n=2 Tax=Anguilla anguilla TaxID=7936 RepID=A0A0E9PCN9_ANGAN
MAIISNAIASGTTRIMDRTHIKVISIAVHLGTPIPLMRFQEATARYLSILRAHKLSTVIPTDVF